MIDLHLTPVRALQLLSLVAAALVASTAQAQQPPPVQGTGEAVIVVPQPTAEYPPVQIVEMPSPYGTAYAIEAPNQRIGMLQQELVSMQAQYSQYSLGAPITLMALGGATTVISGMVFLFSMLANAFDATDRSQNGMLISGIVTLAGIGLLAGGIVWMISTISERRPYGRRIKEIKRELASYGVRASLDLAPVESGVVLTGSVSF